MRKEDVLFHRAAVYVGSFLRCYKCYNALGLTLQQSSQGMLKSMTCSSELFL